MAKVLGPLLSLAASQTIGDSITYSNWRGISTVRVKSNPSNPQSEGQMAGRSYFAAGGKVTKRVSHEGTVYEELREAAPAQQSWASFFVREMLGTGNASIQASITDYEDGGNSTVAGYFDVGASEAGIQGVDLGHEDGVVIPAGAVAWAAYDACFRLGLTAAPVTASSLDASQINAFFLALTGVTTDVDPA